MSARFLDDDARAAFARAIRTIEDASAVEVVVALRRSSGPYRVVNALVGTLVAFAALATMLFSEHAFGLASILVDPFVVGIAAAFLVELLPAVRRLLTPAAKRHANVVRAARAAFVERGVHATTGRSGVLVFISWLERDVVLVPDLGLAARLPDGAIEAAQAGLTAKFGEGGAAVGNELAKLADQMAIAMPHQEDDVNELPDAIDSDLERR
ncbi:MAG: hypothetical protein QM831_08680 [Kofleriaceae bacterium]